MSDNIDNDVQNAITLARNVETTDDAAAADNSDNERSCWVCFGSDEEATLGRWVQPCGCRGATKWVHQNCLGRWIDEKQKGNSMRVVNCPQCQIQYIIVLPKLGTIASLLEGIDSIIKRVSPFLTAGFIVGSLYWTAVTYGAVTVLQVVGHKEGLDFLENSDPFALLVGLPFIPVALVLGRMIRWEDAILQILRRKRTSSRKFPILSLILPLPEESSAEPTGYQNAIPMSDSQSATRVLCGALLLPTVSSLCGRIFFESIQNNVHRAIVGGITFIAVKGMLKIYYKQKQYVRKKQRIILDYTEENIREYERLPKN